MQKPQHRLMEWLQVPNDAARFALLRGKQVDMVVNIPYAIAKDLPRSELTQRGVNPHKGPLWTQTHLANGKMQITFDAELIIKEKLPGWEALQDDPTLKPQVREALELAIDKRAIVENFHYGFTSLNQSIYSMGSFGWRQEQAEKLSPYDPKRAKALLAEAGYPNGFSTTIHQRWARLRPRAQARVLCESNEKNVRLAGIGLVLTTKQRNALLPAITTPIKRRNVVVGPARKHHLKDFVDSDLRVYAVAVASVIVGSPDLLPGTEKHRQAVLQRTLRVGLEQLSDQGFERSLLRKVRVCLSGERLSQGNDLRFEHAYLSASFCCWLGRQCGKAGQQYQG